jgi:putative flippase GtrA
LLTPVLIPTYKPGIPLESLVSTLVASGAAAIIVVDDGSGPEFEGCFRRVAAHERVHLLRHAVNLGKGAALKTGMNHALVHFPDCRGVVTADADGQHHPDDILRVAAELAAHGDGLVTGARQFGAGVPLRSRFGNTLTCLLMGMLVGQKLADTQTGLRGVPAALIPHLLRMTASGYEFELDMLIAAKHLGVRVSEVPIRTIYTDGNRGSHFHPLFDSMRIYFLLFRFSILALMTAAVDNLVFLTAYSVTASIAESQAIGRLVAMIVNYLGARGVVFQSRQRHASVFPKYVALVAVNGVVSYAAIQLEMRWLGLKVMPAKLIAEGLLFIANFAIQRDFIFTKRGGRVPESKTVGSQAACTPEVPRQAAPEAGTD